MSQLQYISSTFSEYCTGYCVFGFNGQEKDQEIYNNQSTTTAMFWEYDGRIGRRWNLDPKPQIFISDYACFGNNPLSFSDLLGDKFKNSSDEQTATTMKKDFKNKENKYKRSADKYGKKMDEAAINGDTKAEMEYFSKWQEADAGVEEMQQAQKEIDELGSSTSEVFTFNRLGSDSKIGFVNKDKDGTIVINYLNFSNKVHETKHAFQHLAGKLEFVEGGVKYADLTDEVEAYKRQFYYSSFSMPSSTIGRVSKVSDITPQWVNGLYILKANGEKDYIYKEYNIYFRLDKSGPHSTENELIRRLLSK